jgi:phosphohistidine phosphatase
MPRLFVMRHAKSSWAVPGARDFDRELNDRGWFDLEKMSKEIKAREYFPEEILCSPSERTRQTLQGIQEVLPESVKVSYPNQLYSSGLSEYLELIQDIEGDHPLMIIGHNPMCGALAAALPKPDSDYPVDEIAYKYPTATIAVIDFDCTSWADIEKGKGNLKNCVMPKSL